MREFKTYAAVSMDSDQHVESSQAKSCHRVKGVPHRNQLSYQVNRIDNPNVGKLHNVLEARLLEMQGAGCGCDGVALAVHCLCPVVDMAISNCEENAWEGQSTFGICT